MFVVTSTLNSFSSLVTQYLDQIGSTIPNEPYRVPSVYGIIGAHSFVFTHVLLGTRVSLPGNFGNPNDLEVLILKSPNPGARILLLRSVLEGEQTFERRNPNWWQRHRFGIQPTPPITHEVHNILWDVGLTTLERQQIPGYFSHTRELFGWLPNGPLRLPFSTGPQSIEDSDTTTEFVVSLASQKLAAVLSTEIEGLS